MDERTLDLIALYGVCADCGSPRMPLEVDEVVVLVCSLVPTHSSVGDVIA